MGIITTYHPPFGPFNGVIEKERVTIKSPKLKVESTTNDQRKEKMSERWPSKGYYSQLEELYHG